MVRSHCIPLPVVCKHFNLFVNCSCTLINVCRSFFWFSSMIATGWGLALYDSGNDLQTFLEISAASRCNVVQQVCQSRVKTRNMLAHIRFATRGEVLLMNVHPFRREMVSLLNRICIGIFLFFWQNSCWVLFRATFVEVDDETHVYALTSSLILSLYTSYVRT